MIFAFRGKSLNHSPLINRCRQAWKCCNEVRKFRQAVLRSEHMRQLQGVGPRLASRGLLKMT